LSDFLPFVVAGLTSGTLYGLAATGLVLTYKTSGIFNFGHGAIAAASAYVFFELSERGMPWPVAVVVTVAVFAPVISLALEWIASKVSGAPIVTTILATVGILVMTQGILEQLFGIAPRSFPSFLPSGTFEVAGVRVGYDQLVMVLVSTACVVALGAFFRYTMIGLRLRAVVDSPDLLDLTGRSPRSVRRIGWAIGCSFASVSGLLLATIVGLDLSFLTLLVVAAFGAAAVGRFRNLTVTFIAALAIGVAAEVVKKYVPDNPVLAGIPPSLPFLVLFGVLLLSPGGRFRDREPRRPVVRHSRLDWRAQVLALAAVVGAALLLPDLVGARLPVYTNAAIFVILFASLALLVQLSGQVSLCHMSFAAVGATTFSHLTQGAGLPWGVALLAAGLVTIPIGALLSVPAIRLSTLYLALATFGFGILVQQFAFLTGSMFGAGGLRTAARPDVLGLAGDRGFFYLCAGAAALTIALVVLVARTRLGRLLNGLADSSVAIAAHGAEVSITRTLVFCLSASMAGVAGALLISLSGTASANGTTFSFYQSLMLLVVLTISGRSLVVAPVVGAVLLVVLPSYSSNPSFAAVQSIVFGALAILVATLQPTVTEAVRGAARRSEWRRRPALVRTPDADPAGPVAPPVSAVTG
jgi:branched-subunit amino acid ABC-type transport system permease component